ncbi:maleylpyruvate isomerase family mycothiol-dependent enzyme [Kocuria sp. U4B]|jgi:uncharacterized protein (TIGR03083 family)|nr:maleylpyruvate isomerase family mycothiol-dependent enzyme [Kocuria rosea]
MSSYWSATHAERAALARDLQHLSEEQWAEPSLCAGLTVREVLAHLTAGAALGPARWFAGVVGCRFDFDRQVAVRLAEQLGTDGADTLRRFDAVRTGTRSPTGSRIVPLGEAVVHAEDIRRPLGIHRAYPPPVLTRLAEYHSGSDFVVVGRRRVQGLRLEAADGPFATGDGPLVTGPTLALLMATVGRAAYLDDLEGDGVEVLRDRSRPA